MTQPISPGPRAVHDASCPCTQHDTGAPVRALWHTMKGPWPVLADLARIPHEERTPGMTFTIARWVDHPYMFRGEGGRWTYVAEPYSLCADDFPSLLALRDAGFSVHICADAARHTPGRTLAVVITTQG